MKWLVIVLAFFFSGCAPSKYAIETKISDNHYRIEVLDHYLDVHRIFHIKSRSICEDYEFINIITDSSQGGPFIKLTGEIACPKKGLWINPSNTKDQHRKDYYECEAEATLLSGMNRTPSRVVEALYMAKDYRNRFKSCLRARGYVWVEKEE